MTNEVRELKREGVTETNLVSSVDWVVREGLSEEATFKKILESEGTSLEKTGIGGGESIAGRGNVSYKGPKGKRI